MLGAGVIALKRTIRTDYDIGVEDHTINGAISPSIGRCSTNNTLKNAMILLYDPKCPYDYDHSALIAFFSVLFVEHRPMLGEIAPLIV